MPEREVRYCTTEDGVRIAYCVAGEGVPLLVCPGFVESFALEHVVPEEAEFMRRLREGRRLIRFDMRGTGLSQRESVDFSPRALASDLDAVIRSSHARQCYIWASTLSGPRAIQYAADHPRRVLGLLLYGTFARATDLMAPEAMKGMADFIRTNPDLALRTIVGNIDAANPDSASRFAEMYRMSASADTVVNLLLSGYETTDVTQLLSRIRARALVLHRIGDTVVPFAVGQALASGLPNASFVPLTGTVRPYTFGDNEPILGAIEAFLNEGPETRRLLPAVPQPAEQGLVRTVLFTDLVGHTEMMQRLGDEQGRAVLREHERITRETLAAHGGVEVKTMGDGFMASFGSVTKAVECAIALQRAFDAWNTAGGEHAGSPLRVRVGLNAGEPIAEDGDLFGSSVILASRVAAQAGAGEILIPEPVRHLLAGKDFLFSDRREVALKGFEDAVRLYEVRWREEA